MRFIFIRYLFVCVFITSIAWAASLDTPIAVKTREQMLVSLNSFRGELPPQVTLDLAVAVRAIERQCDDPSIGLSEKERDNLCAALVDGRTIRQIILTAASLMLAESAELGAPGAAADGSKLRGDEFARWRYLTFNRSAGLGFVKTYSSEHYEANPSTVEKK